MREIWVSGCPSFVGGADTELFHQVILWRKNGVTVHLVPTCEPCDEMKVRLRKLKCRIWKYYPGLFNDKFVVSYCNGEALQALLDDAANKPRAFVWFNCMTWTTPNEIEAMRRGLITHLGFVSEYQKNYLMDMYAKELPEMCRTGKVYSGRSGFPRIIDYIPWLDISQFKRFKKSPAYFGIGRISRDDAAKFSSDCWRIFDRVLTPGPKKTFILGYGPQIEKVIGPPPEGLDWQWWTAGSISSSEFFSKIDVLLHKTGGSRESYCRVFVEAMAHGIVPLAEREFAFPEILKGSKELEEFLLCNTSDEMSYKASQLAFYPNQLSKLKGDCRRYAERHFTAIKPAMDNWLKLLNST